jgi:peptide-methionine (R)-S-oxide reductase
MKPSILRLALLSALAIPVLASRADAADRSLRTAAPPVPAEAPPAAPFTRVVKTDEEWRRLLKPAAYRILRQEGTEIAFTGALWNEHRRGSYRCAGCGLELFGSDTKFDSGTGWPSFWRPAWRGVVAEKRDESHDMLRVEAECARCGGHLGHVFEDGPEPTGLRYCINSAALTFVPAR